MFPQLLSHVNKLMSALSTGLRKILGYRLVGVYLGGSTAAGDSMAGSNLDFLVVTDGPLSMEDALAITLLHQDLAQRHPAAKRLEGDYAPLHMLIPEGTTGPVPGCEQGVFLPRVGEIMLSADNICDMRVHGLAYFGPQAHDILPEVTSEQVRAAVRESLSHGLGSCDSPEQLAAECLNLVRSMCALETGAPTTRKAGALWARSHLDPRWRPVIEAALAICNRTGGSEDSELLREGLAGLDEAVRHSYYA